MKKTRELIESGNAVLGIEFGSTRIKAVLIDQMNNPIATGGHSWENSLVDNIWTYSLEEVKLGLQSAYKELSVDVMKKYNTNIKSLAGLGISGMMHGYIALDENNNLLVPFRTWRNNITGEASGELRNLFNYPIPQRWSIAHLYQCILNNDEHVENVRTVTTLAGYVHWLLTGKKVMGVGEASGMFPIDIRTGSFNKKMLAQFDELINDRGYLWKTEEILPTVLVAGKDAGYLSDAGALLIDPSGILEPAIPLCPPEGDAGTGMVATNSIRIRMGNVSAGTSVFACVVLEDDLSKAYEELDQVTTPDGKLVAMAHSNNCTSDLNAWVDLFGETVSALGYECDKNTLFETLYNKALEGDDDAGGLLSYGYISGEHMTHFEEGRPLFVRAENSRFNLANFMRAHLFTALSAMRLGLDILFEKENVRMDEILGHGGLFKTEGVGQKIMAAVTETPVTVMETAGEGGAWGMAVLAAYMSSKDEMSLDDFLTDKVFNELRTTTVSPDENDVEGYRKYLKRYVEGLKIERTAVENI